MSAMRPKPWESGGMASSTGTGTSAAAVAPGVPAAAAAGTGTAAASGSQYSSSLSAATGVPPLPARPTNLSNVTPSTAYTPGNQAYGGAGSYGGYGATSGYSGYGGYGGSSYPYGSGSYGSYGGYGGMGGYGSYGGMGGYGGYNRYGMGGYGQGMVGPGGPGGPMENSTAATFQLIESIVGAFGGFAQMLESTYMATHSSFFAMMSVAEQFGYLKQSLGSILGIFAVLRWSRALIAKLTGRTVPTELTVAEFAKFQSRGLGSAPNGPRRPSFKPLIIFLTAVFGLPYLLGKLIRNMADQSPHQDALVENGETVDPSRLQFCRAIYDFVPENPQIEVELKKGDLLAVLATSDPAGNPSQWWRVRSRDGRSGYVPSTYVELIPRQLTDDAAAKGAHKLIE